MFNLPIFFSRYFSPIPMDVRLNEKHEIGVEITEIPVEDGSSVNDHAYVKQSKLSIEFASDNATLVWQTIKRLVKTRQPFTIVTGLDVYTNMMVNMATATIDKDNSRILRGSVDLAEIMIADTAYGFSIPDGKASSTGAAAGQAGGGNSTRSAQPSPSRSGDAATADASTGTVSRGDSPTVNPHPNTPEQNQSILAGMFS